jgi:hypothetical protein
MSEKLAKIYYRNREINYINISFGGEHRSIYIGSASEISGQTEILFSIYEKIPCSNCMFIFYILI